MPELENLPQHEGIPAGAEPDLAASALPDADAPAGGPLPAGKTWEEYIALQYARTLLSNQPDNPGRKENYVSHAMSLIKQLDPRDAVEKMLAGQLVVLQARIQFLNRISLTQTDRVWSHLYSSQLDRAIAGYHKALASLKEHQRPRRRRRTTVTTIRTAHITAQQVIQPQALYANAPQPQIEKAQPQSIEGPPAAPDRQT
jgi:hypothetical protein